MDLFQVYPLFDITPVKAEGCWITDKDGNRYLDLYGGHAVISIGHSHPHFVTRLEVQLNQISFYSNSVRNPTEASSRRQEPSRMACNNSSGKATAPILLLSDST